jgi:uncharacterized protein YgiM (DUF1202 family)
MESKEALLSRTFSRRGVLGLIAGAGAAVATGLAVTDAGANTGVKYTTTAALNLRSKPNSTSSIIRVVPKGAVVIDYDGELVNGYRSIDYNGSVGWVLNSFLVKGTVPPPTPVIIGGARTTAAVNFRKGPGTGYNVIKVVASGTWVEITATVENGFRYVVLNGTAGWIADAYLGGSQEGAFITTAAVNLRSGASTSHSIKLVVPKGATVVDYDDDIVNGFRHVDYKGTTGWISNAFLKKA